MRAQMQLNRLPVRLAAAAVLLVLLPAARCQQQARTALSSMLEAAARPREVDTSAPSAAEQQRDLADFTDYESLLTEAATAWLAQRQGQRPVEDEDAGLPSSLRSPAGAPSRGILEQLLQRPSGGGGGGQADLGSLFGTLLNSQGGGGGGGLAGLLTTTTAKPTRIFDKFVNYEGNPFATQRPEDGVTQNPLSSVTSKTSNTADSDDEVEKFDAGFQIFSQIFSGNNGVDGSPADGFADASSLQATTITTTRVTQPPPPPPQQQQAPAGWPFYTTPRPPPVTTPHQPPPPPPPPQQQHQQQQQQQFQQQPQQPQHNFNGGFNTNNIFDKQDNFVRPAPPTRAPRPPGLPFYYNPDAPPQGPPPPPEPEPQIKLGVLLSSVTQLVRSDGPSMIAAVGDAYNYIQDGNILGLLQGVIPVFSRATPVIMNMLSSVAPVVEKSDLYGPPIPGSPGITGLFGSLSGLFGGGRRRPQRRNPLVRNAPPGYSQPYYMGQVIGSGLKLITYLINHGTTVVRAREPSDITWLRDAIGEENVRFVSDLLQRFADGEVARSL